MKNESLMKILIAPHISEKGTFVADRLNQYVFEVIKDASKPEIKRAVELLFNVKVTAVRVSNVRAKTKRFGRIEGKHKGWKKAYVSLQEGNKIDLVGQA
jgi:large subunit ribosomal protein L23